MKLSSTMSSGTTQRRATRPKSTVLRTYHGVKQPEYKRLAAASSLSGVLNPYWAWRAVVH